MIARAPAMVVVSCAVLASAGAALAADAGSGAVAGKVSFSGAVPPAQKVKLAADPKCAALHPGGLEKEPVKVKDGGLADVLVYVKCKGVFIT